MTGMQGGAALVLLRAAATACLLSAFGTLVLGAFVAPRALARASVDVRFGAMRILSRLCWASLLAALLATAAWLVGETAHLAGTTGILDAVSTVPLVLSGTFFGHLVATRLVLLACLLVVMVPRPSRARWRLATIVCGATVCLLGGSSHAWAMHGGPSWLLVSEIVHLLSAGAWLGGLLPLLLLVSVMPPSVGAAACRWFSPLGKLCVGGIVLSAAWQFFFLVGGPAGLFGTTYGRIAGLKMLLFVVLLGFAVVNRYRLAPALRSDAWAAARRRLVGSIALQTCAGLLAVTAAAFLSSFPPAVSGH